MLRETLYMTLYAFIRATQGMCISAYRDPRLYNKEDHWGILVPLPREFIEAIRTEGLDDLMAGSEFDSVHRGSLVKCAFGRSAFDMYWDAIADEADYWE